MLGPGRFPHSRTPKGPARDMKGQEMRRSPEPVAPQLDLHEDHLQPEYTAPTDDDVRIVVEQERDNTANRLLDITNTLLEALHSLGTKAAGSHVVDLPKQMHCHIKDDGDIQCDDKLSTDQKLTSTVI